MEKEKKQKKGKNFQTLMIHGNDEGKGNSAEGTPTIPPLAQSTAFNYNSAEAMADVFQGRKPGHVYTRLTNPTIAALEERITAACGARGTLAVASGMTAIAMGLLAILKSGDELLAGKYLFGGSYVLFEHTFKNLGIKVKYFDPRDPEEAKKLITPATKGIFLEAVANPAMVVPDFSAYHKICAPLEIPLLVDATLITPYLYDRDVMGADLVFFSASKYLSGAATTIGGLIVDTGLYPWHKSKQIDLGDHTRAGENALLTRLNKELMASVGPSLSPMNAFLQFTGMESLAIRMDYVGTNAKTVAGFLKDHTKTKEVLYPGLPDHPAHDLIKKQFKGNGGGVLALRLESKEACFRFLNALKLFKRSTNLGDTRSLAIHPASTIYGNLWQAEQESLGVTDDLIRLSIGLEHPSDLTEDLAQALEGSASV